MYPIDAIKVCIPNLLPPSNLNSDPSLPDANANPQPEHDPSFHKCHAQHIPHR